MEPKELVNQYRAKIAEGNALAAPYKGKESEMPRDVQERIAAVLGKADEIKALIDLAEKMQEGEKFLSEPVGGPKAATYRPASPVEGTEFVDLPSWRSFKVATPFGEREFRYNVPERIARIEKAYNHAFEAYIRLGERRMGNNDYKTLTEGIDSAGGVLVPPDFQGDILRKVATMAVMRPLCRVVQTSRDKATWARVNYTTDDDYTSGARFTWTGESPSSATVHRVTEPVFGQVNIDVHTAMASLPLGKNLIEDSAFDVLGIASDVLAEAFSLGEDNVFINGTGGGQPTGLVAEVVSTSSNTSPRYVASGASGAISTSGDVHSGVALVNLYYAVPAQYRRNGVWVMESATLQQVDIMVDANKRPLAQPLLQASLANGEPEVIKGRPVYVDEFVPAIAANSYSVIFGDLKGYIILDRVGMSVERLDELYAETNISLLLARKRVGGYCAQPERIRVLKCAAS